MRTSSSTMAVITFRGHRSRPNALLLEFFRAHARETLQARGESHADCIAQCKSSIAGTLKRVKRREGARKAIGMPWPR
jgi:hypothetical protein